MSPRRDLLLAAATAATALHVLDDATLHREPGTTIADHVTGAGATLAVLAVAAVVFPRLRAGAQASLALLLGLFAVTLGGLHVAEIALQGRLKGGDATGLLTLAAGICGLAIGAATLWQSRRRDGIDFLARRPDVEPGRIGGLGLSVGGELLLQAAASDRRLAAVVSEGAGYRTLRENLKQGGAGPWLLAPQAAVLFGATRVLSPAAPPEQLDALVPRIAPNALFLIEAGHGQGSEGLNGLYFSRAQEPKLYWLIPEAQHTGGLGTRPAEYERRVVGFFDRHL